MPLDLRNCQIDVRSELEPFEWGHNAKWTHDKLIAASPFRYDKTPSFFVRLEPWGDYPAGIWSDSGAYDADYASGDIVKLLSFLRNETREETEEYLFEMYGPRSDGQIELIARSLRHRRTYSTLDEGLITTAPSPYLSKRGISEQVQLEAGIGRSMHKNFAALPWRSADGRLLNIKYRATRGKTFFYERNATPIRRLVYGAETVKGHHSRLIICEAEIDALSWRTAGFQAVAIGGVAFSREQADILKRLPVESYALAGDNDKAGQRFNARIVESLVGADLRLIQYVCDSCKDANDVLLKKDAGVDALRQMYEQALSLPRLNARALSIY